MFKTMLDTQMIFYLMGVIGGIGIPVSYTHLTLPTKA